MFTLTKIQKGNFLSEETLNYKTGLQNFLTDSHSTANVKSISEKPFFREADGMLDTFSHSTRRTQLSFLNLIKGQIKAEKKNNFNTQNSSQHLNNQNFTLFQNKFRVEKRIFTKAITVSIQTKTFIAKPWYMSISYLNPIWIQKIFKK